MNINAELNNVEVEYLIDLIETDRENSKVFSEHKTRVVENLVKKLTIPVVSASKDTLCDYCNGSKLDPKNETLYYKPCPRCS